MTPYYNPIRLAIADDHEFFREGFINSIHKKSAGKIQVVSEAGNGIELLRELEKTKPDVVITDIKMPEMDGFEVCKKITEKYPSIPVVALSMLDEHSVILDMFEAGAKGYLIKNTPAQEVIEAIETVNEGQMHYCSMSSKSLIKAIGVSKYNQYKKNNSIQFADIEISVMRSICNQLLTKEIASELNLSVKMIEEYSRRLKQKTGARNLVGIVLYALRNGIVSLYEI